MFHTYNLLNLFFLLFFEQRCEAPYACLSMKGKSRATTHKIKMCIILVLCVNIRAFLSVLAAYLLLVQQLFKRSVSCHGNRHPIPGNRAPTVTMTGWHVSLQLPVSLHAKWRRRVGDL